MGKFTFREHEVETRKRTRDHAARVTIPDKDGGGYRDFFAGTESEVEQEARKFIRTRRPWRNEDEKEEPEVA